MHRFYCPEIVFDNPPIIITDAKELHHLRDVLRLKKGDKVQVFNQNGEEATGRVLASQPRQVSVSVESIRKHAPRLPWITLACAIPKKSKFEWIIEKSVELGVDEIIPLMTRRTEIELKGERLEKRTVRYQEVAVNAAKQSQRLTVPIIHAAVDFPSALTMLSKDTVVFIPSLVGPRRNILEAIRGVPSPKRIAFLIGPEGDFTPEEYALARQSGCIPVSLGETVLKVETAAIAAVVCANLFYSDARKPCP